MLILAIVFSYYTGVAKVPAFFTEQCDGRAKPVAVYATRGGREIGEVRRSSNCVPLFVEEGKTRGEVPVLEDGYEERAFVVVSRAGRWAEIRLDRGTGWIHLGDGDSIVAYEDLVLNRMAELTEAWDGRVYTKPGGRARRLHLQSRDVTVVDSKRIGHELWFEVRLIDGSSCSGHEPIVAATGWVRAYSAKREPVVRHFSRGC